MAATEAAWEEAAFPSLSSKATPGFNVPDVQKRPLCELPHIHVEAWGHLCAGIDTGHKPRNDTGALERMVKVTIVGREISMFDGREDVYGRSKACITDTAKLSTHAIRIDPSGSRKALLIERQVLERQRISAPALENPGCLHETMMILRANGAVQGDGGP
jgi:hypothetical protein